MFKKLLNRFPYALVVGIQTVGLPLLLAFLGFLEWNAYAAESVDTLNVEQVQQIKALDQALIDVQRDRYLKIEIDGRAYQGSMATYRLNAIKASVQRSMAKTLSADSLGQAQTASTVAMVCGVLAGLLGLVGMLGLVVSGRSAMRSRDALLQRFGRWTRLLPVYLGALLLLLALGYGALTVVRTYSTIELFMNRPRGGQIKLSFALWGLAACMAFLALAAVWRLRGALASLEGAASEVRAIALTQQEAPGLWAHVSEVAKAVGAPVPTNIVLGMEDSFYVTAHATELLPSKRLLSGQTLHLPLTYLTLLRRDEVDAILAHELGHFAGEDTAYSARFSPLYAGVIGALQRIDADDNAGFAASPAVYFSRYVLQRFDLAVKHWSRVRELAADAVSARIGGPEASARALVHITALAPRVNERVAEIARRPEEAGHDLIAMLGESVRNAPLEAPNFDEESATAHPHDTHPPTVDRIKALGVALSPMLVHDALAPPDERSLAWVRSLFLDSERVQRQLLDEFKDAAKKKNDGTREVLQTITSSVEPRVEIRDSLMGVAFYLVVALMCSVFVLPMVYAYLFYPDATRLWSVFNSVSVAATLFLWAAVVKSYWRRKLVIMVLSPRGFQMPGIQQVVSWGVIESYAGKAAFGGIGVVFTLSLNAPALTLVPGPFKLKYRPKKRTLTFKLQGVRGKQIGEFFPLIEQYRLAWHAQAALEVM